MAQQEDEEREEEEDMEEEEEVDTKLSNPEVVLKYKTAGKFADQVVKEVAERCVAGASVLELCLFGDKRIEELVTSVYKQKDKKTGRHIERGIALPTCVSVNNIICHNTPMGDDVTKLIDGDIVRIDLGVHIDGFVALTATTTIVGGDSKLSEVLLPKAADVFACAKACQDAALRCMRPGKCNHDVTEVIAKICEDYGVVPCEGVLSHQLDRFAIDLPKCILLKRVGGDSPQKVEKVDFSAEVAYAAAA